MLLLNSGQFNYDFWEFANFPNFCRDAKVFVCEKGHKKNSISDSPLNENIFVKKYLKENMFLEVFVS